MRSDRHGIALHRLAAACALSAALPGAALASTSQAWVLRNRGDFQEARLEGVALSPEGSLHLSAHVSLLMDPAQPNLWSLARDAKGRLYAGSGNAGKIFRIDPGSGKGELYFDAEELEVHALAVDPGGALYAGTSPRGAVYRIEESGARTIIFDPEETYIWALAFDSKGRLYVATGHRGRLYRVDAVGPNAAGTVVLNGREEHIRSLAVDRDGTIYAGSDQSGIIYKVTATGESSVVYDSPMREIAALSIAPDALYAAALAPMPRQRPPGAGGQPASGAGVQRIRVTADDPGPEGGQPPGGSGDDEPEGQPRQPQTPRPAAVEAYYGVIYRITPDGYTRKIWESREALPLCLAPYGEGRLAVGTGNEGRVLILTERGEATDYVKLDSQQVNALLAEPSGDLVAAASNLARVARISTSGADEGTVTSRPLDAGFTATWGTMSWNAELPRGASVVFRARSGNTEQPDESWSAWSGDYADPGGVLVDRPGGRYLQWQAILRAARGGPGPVLRGVQINYIQDNLPPEIESVDVQAPGVVLISAGAEPGEGSGGRRGAAQARRGYEKGRRAVQWKAADANGDELRFDVFFKAEDETSWKALGRALSEDFHTWDAASLPDGTYRIRVEATDAPSNPPGAALSGARVSAAFDVDNTPPELTEPQARLLSRSAEVTVTVTDSFSAITEAAWSLDGGEWVPVLPEDGISDSRRESYRLRTPELQPGEHAVYLRARDRAGNTAAARVVIRAEPAGKGK